MGNWSELQHEMLELIAQHLIKIEDYVTFGSVCTSWRAAASSKENFKGLRLRQKIPYLMLSAEENKDQVDRDFYSLLDKELVAKLSLPRLQGKICYESLGWLLAVGQEGDMCLLHPFSGAEIELPHQNTYQGQDDQDSYNFVKKMVLSARPCETSEFVVMLICGSDNSLAFWRPGEKKWNRIELQEAHYCDITFYQGHFYAIDSSGYVVVCDSIEYNFFKARLRACLQQGRFEVIYIVKSSSSDKESLLAVTQDNYQAEVYLDGQDIEDLDNEIYYTTRFKVYELDLSGRAISPRKEIKNLGNRALFLGGYSASSSFEIPLDNKLAPPGIKPNHIYFIFIPEEAGKYMGEAYNVETGYVELFGEGSHMLRYICPSIWIAPKF